jgi:hypothetical protein
MSTMRKGYQENEEVEIYANSGRVTHHLRARGTNEKRISTPIPHKIG